MAAAQAWQGSNLSRSAGAARPAGAAPRPGTRPQLASPSSRAPDHLQPAAAAGLGRRGEAAPRTLRPPAGLGRRREAAPRTLRPPAALASDDSEGEDADIAAARARLVAASPSSTTITGPELRALVKEKYGRDYACLLAKRGRRVFFQILWKHLEQASYPQTLEEHEAVYDAVASYISEWGAGATVRAGIAAASRRGPGFTGGGAARAISIPLDVDLSTARSGEFF